MRPRSKTLYALAALLGIGSFVGMALLGERTLESLAVTFVASLAASVMVIFVVERPMVAFGLLFLLASVSGIVLGLPLGRVRLEQPSIIAALAALLVTGGWPRRSDLRPVLPIAASFAVYLVVLTVASALYAPKPEVSARMIIWTVLSMAGGVAVFALLIRSGLDRVEAWFTGTGVLHAMIGLAIAGAFLVMGPTGIPGMQTSPGEVPKVAGLAFEANLYASMLVALVPFALDRFRAKPGLATAIPVIVIIVGIGLGVTRGAYLGLFAGLLLYLVIVAYRSPRASEVLGVLPVLVMALLLAPTVAAIALPIERNSGPVFETPGPAASGSLCPSPPVGSSSCPAHAPSPSPSPVADTVGYRLDRIPTALNDLRTSPIIGLGAATFGQRHDRPYLPPGTVDYIGTLALVAVYESGLIGAAGLAFGFALSFRLFLRVSRNRPGPAAAYAASIASLLVAYQATNALFFSINWIILAAGLAFAVRAGSAPVSHSL